MCSYDDSSPVGRNKPLELLEREITELASHIHAATCRWLGLVAEFDRREGWADWGCRSCAHWVSWRCGIAPVAAREHVRVARRLEELPSIRAAFADGQLSYSQVRALTRVEKVDKEEELLSLARHATAAQLERLVRAYRGVVVRARVAERGGPERFVTWSHDDDGSLVLRARLPAEEGAVVVAALEAGVDGLVAAHDASAEAPRRDEDASAEAPVRERASAEALPRDDEDASAEAPLHCRATGRRAGADGGHAASGGACRAWRRPPPGARPCRAGGAARRRRRRPLRAGRRGAAGGRDGAANQLRRRDRAPVRARRAARQRRAQDPQRPAGVAARAGQPRRRLPLPRLHQPPDGRRASHRALGKRRRDQPGQPRPALPPPPPARARGRLQRHQAGSPVGVSPPGRPHAPADSAET